MTEMCSAWQCFKESVFAYSRLHRRANRGVALVEAAIVLPVLIFIILSVLEGALLLNRYLIMSQIAFTSARSLAQLTGISEVCFENENVIDLYEEDEPTGEGIRGHWSIQRRAYLSLQLNVAELTAFSDGDGGLRLPSITTEFIGPDGENCQSWNALSGSPGLRDYLRNTAAVKIFGDYSGTYLPINFELEAVSRVVYLFTTEQFPVYGDPVATPPGANAGGYSWNPADGGGGYGSGY